MKLIATTSADVTEIEIIIVYQWWRIKRLEASRRKKSARFLRAVEEKRKQYMQDSRIAGASKEISSGKALSSNISFSLI